MSAPDTQAVYSACLEGRLLVVSYEDGRGVAECSCGWWSMSMPYDRASYSARAVHEGALERRASEHLFTHLPDGEPF